MQLTNKTKRKKKKAVLLQILMFFNQIPIQLIQAEKSRIFQRKSTWPCFALE